MPTSPSTAQPYLKAQARRNEARICVVKILLGDSADVQRSTLCDRHDFDFLPELVCELKSPGNNVHIWQVKLRHRRRDGCFMLCSKDLYKGNTAKPKLRGCWSCRTPVAATTCDRPTEWAHQPSAAYLELHNKWPLFNRKSSFFRGNSPPSLHFQ